MKKYFALAAFCGFSLFGGASHAATLTYDGTAHGFRTVHFDASPVTPRFNPALAGGFLMSDSARQFVAYCLDITKQLLSSADYVETDTPWSFNPLGTSVARVQSIFDANYAAVDTAAESAALQIALWNVIYDTDWDLTAGAFQAHSDDASVNAFAATFLANAQGYTGPKAYDLTFYEATGNPRSQSLVTMSPVPVPAAGLLLLSALGAGAAMARRRKRS
ncbi:thioester domain-containing protein [Maliponia aquimaris]|uniref:VPLPA-CTERM protein sorting domain-containing protein n=1 Tax=Maliponia aquimaris TaxID=1673631 RepID=A0A238JTC2_9RHOB|nr:thioester domain-containing protein [Maliponia aquimaris]SMX32996.1 hypothetical protein MAA8898_00373 [Maliponia aquimaris]